MKLAAADGASGERTARAGVLAPIARRLGELSGWRRALAAVLLGALATLALPPIGWWPMLFPGFIGLLWLIDGAGTGWRAFWAGWWFGLGHHTVGLYWIANALLVDVAQFWWLIPFSVLGLPALLGVFTGAAGALARALGGTGRGYGVPRALALAAAWSVAEYARGNLLSGFPWNLLGYAWVDVTPVAQAAALVGVYGLGLATLLVILPIGVWLAEGAGGGRAAFAVGSIALGAVIVGHGVARVTATDVGAAPGILLRIIQPNVPQSLKWNKDQREAIFRQLLEMSAAAASGARPDLILWPETAVPYFLESDANARAAIARVTPRSGLVITGALRLGRDEGEPEGTVSRAWNAVMALNDRGEIVARYDKAHLVPFGEYVPARKLLPLRRITQNGLDFTPGPGPRTLLLPGVPSVGPLVCYEVIFPDEVVDSAGRPDWLLEVTNDGWFGGSAGPYQHFAMARLRSVEQGLPMVIAANTGISGVIDPWGRVEVKTRLGEVATVDHGLPKSIAPPLYARLGDWLALVGCAVVALAALVMKRSKAHLSSRQQDRTLGFKY